MCRAVDLVDSLCCHIVQIINGCPYIIQDPSEFLAIFGVKDPVQCPLVFVQCPLVLV